MSAPSQKLERWVITVTGEVTSDEDHPDPVVTRLELHHAVEGEGSILLSTHEMASVEDSSDLVQEIWDEATHDASTRSMGTHQRYVVQAWRGKDASRSSAQHAFIIQGHLEADALDGNTEPATVKGERAQQMRMVATIHEQHMNLWERTLPKMASENERLSKRLIDAEERGVKIYELMQDLQDRKLERDLVRAEAQETSKRTDQIMDMVIPLLPMIGLKLLGKTGIDLALPGTSSPGAAQRDTMISSLLSTLEMDELSGMLQTLPAEKQALFLSIFKAYAESHNQKQSEKPKVYQNGSEEKEAHH